MKTSLVFEGVESPELGPDVLAAGTGVIGASARTRP